MTPHGDGVSGLKLVGGELCLDFVNTVDWHASDSPDERLTDYGRLLSWSRQAGVLDEADERRLRTEAARNRIASQKALKQVLVVREALYRMFVAVVHGRPMDEADLALVSKEYARAQRSLRLVPVGDRLEWQWAGDPGDLEVMLWPILRSAIDLLTSDLRLRIGQCADDRGCGWLFLDTSRNRSRRWCAMEDCGNRAKARRHHEHARVQRAPCS